MNLQAWNETMLKIWRERIVSLRVFDSHKRTAEPHLLDSIRAFPVRQNGQLEEITLAFSFPAYGIFQDRGTGKEKSRGNGGDIGPARKDGKPRRFRQARPWFSKAWYATAMNLKDALAAEIGDTFTGIMQLVSNEE